MLSGTRCKLFFSSSVGKVSPSWIPSSSSKLWRRSKLGGLSHNLFALSWILHIEAVGLSSCGPSIVRPLADGGYRWSQLVEGCKVQYVDLGVKVCRIKHYQQPKNVHGFSVCTE